MELCFNKLCFAKDFAQCLSPSQFPLLLKVHAGSMCKLHALQEKLRRRVSSVEVKILNPPRDGKKCLVLDIDYTLFDLGSSAERPEELGRPYLHHFLTSAYEHYDLVIWSATNMKWVDVKMQQLGVTNNPNYKITFMLDHKAMMTVRTEKYGKYAGRQYLLMLPELQVVPN